MTFTIDADDSRSIKALEIAARAACWIKVTIRDTGEVAFGIPSQCSSKPDLYYIVTAISCDCEDAKRHALSRPRIGDAGYHGNCKHSRAVRLHLELLRAQEMRRRPERRHLRAVPTAADYDRIIGAFEEAAF